MVQDFVLPKVQFPTRNWQLVASLIDHTLLKPQATVTQITRLCEEAMLYGFCSVMVTPDHVAQAKAVLRGSPVRVGTVVAFPMGTTLTSVKLFEAAEAIKLGAEEIDMVINIGALKAGNRMAVETEIRSVARLVHGDGAILKTILETALLDEKEKILACALSAAGGADFVKTSTGFVHGGAAVRDVVLMRGVVGHKLGVKAAGGIRSAADVEALLDAGASRIGTSASVAIVRELGAPE